LTNWNMEFSVQGTRMFNGSLDPILLFSFH
jgi:hypothetical protein